MERLTEHHANEKLGAYMICSGACIDDDFDCNACEKLAEMVDRLAAYEDTGLEPEEIKELCTDDVADIAKLFRRMIADGSLDRLQKLLQAEEVTP